ncbi:MAG: imidazole glycerol phosphate synthase subunit HisH, partial [Lachnospiraceae bacterium]|nr:imidazole glycerol phosphate synthase subunit HisH [Lachnospiraceae bacterium]
YLQAEDAQIVTATTEYAAHIHASVEDGNVFACQFHPEKSSDVGMTILKNFLSISK